MSVTRRKVDIASGNEKRVIYFHVWYFTSSLKAPNIEKRGLNKFKQNT